VNNNFVLISFVWRLVYFLNDTQYNILLFFFLLCMFTKNYKYFSSIFFLYYFFFLKNENNHYLLYSTIMWDLNLNLTNGLCLVHPFLVYSVYIYLIFYSFKKYNVFYYWISMFLLKKVLYINFFALMLGSWWAYQELNWGGWWNWDFVELILFIFFIKLVILNHKFSFSKTLYIYVYNFVFFFYLIIFFIFVRWDILNSVHSFNLVSVFENYASYISGVSLIFLTIYLLFLSSVYIELKIKYRYLKKTNKLGYINFGLNFIIIAILIFFFFNVWESLEKQTDQNENVFFLRLILILIIFWVNINLNKKNLYPIYLGVIFLKNFINIIFFLSINMFLLKKTNWLIKSLHITGLIVLLIYTYCNDFQFFLSQKDDNYLINNVCNVKNNLLIIRTPIYESINISGNKSTFNTDLLTSIDFFKITSELLSFFTITKLEFFYLKTYNYFLLIFWFFIFFWFLNIICIYYIEKKNINYIY
jgi:cytochrome c biogenesis factor